MSSLFIDMLSRLRSLVLLLTVAACGGDVASTRPTPAQEFVIEVAGEQFRLRTTNLAAATALDERRRTGVLGVVSGRIVRGDGGFNAPWSWHLDPLSIEVPQASIELCDGRPSMVQSDLDYWVDTVQRYCPWAARVYDAQ
jgi:hypothetical protein